MFADREFSTKATRPNCRRSDDDAFVKLYATRALIFRSFFPLIQDFLTRDDLMKHHIYGFNFSVSFFFHTYQAKLKLQRKTLLYQRRSNLKY